jgi:hypothetical protein
MAGEAAARLNPLSVVSTLGYSRAMAEGWPQKQVVKRSGAGRHQMLAAVEYEQRPLGGEPSGDDILGWSSTS